MRANSWSDQEKRDHEQQQLRSGAKKGSSGGSKEMGEELAGGSGLERNLEKEAERIVVLNLHTSLNSLNKNIAFLSCT